MPICTTSASLVAELIKEGCVVYDKGNMGLRLEHTFLYAETPSQKRRAQLLIDRENDKRRNPAGWTKWM